MPPLEVREESGKVTGGVGAAAQELRQSRARDAACSSAQQKAKQPGMRV